MRSCEELCTGNGSAVPSLDAARWLFHGGVVGAEENAFERL